MTEPWQPYPAQPPQGGSPGAPGWQQPGNPAYPAGAGPGYPYTPNPAGQGYPAPGQGYPANPTYPPGQGYPANPGYPEPHYPQGPGYWGPPPMPVPSRSKTPYVIGALLLVLGIIAAITAVAWGIGAASDAVAGSSFGSGEAATVSLQAGEPKIIYVSTAGRTHVNCHLSGDPGHISLKQYSGELTVNQYEAVFTISADQSGDHTVTCLGAGDPTFTIGDDASTSIGMAVGGGFIGGFIAFAGAVVLLVTFLRHRRKPVTMVPAPPYPYQ